MGQCASSQHQREEDIVVDLTDESLLSPRGTHAICDGYVDPQRLATQMRFFRRLVQKQKLAPFWIPEDEESANGAFEYCSICACYYKSVNVTECCKFHLCSECHARNVNGFAFREEKDSTTRGVRYGGWIRSRRTRAAAMKPTCVCCRQEDYKILYRGVKTKKEREEALEEKKQTEMSLERAKVGVEEESRRRQSLAKEGNGERGDVPKGWEEEYSMARLAEEGGSPRARQEIAEMGFDRVALRVNGRNSSGLTPSQRMSLLRGRSEMFAEMYDALFDDDDGAADGDRRGSQRSRRSFDLGSRRNSQEFRRNSEEFFQRGTLPSLTESEENTTSTTATTTRSIQEQRRLVQDFRNMVLEELYLSEAIYRSMLDVHEDEGENVHRHVEEEEEEEEGNNSETEDASDFEEQERDQTGTSRYASSTSRDTTSSDSEESEEN